ncbi:hypothetical protein Tco_1525192 [Tanacetum coccineum]
MSDSDESGVTHTEVFSPFEDLSDIGSLRDDDHEYLELPYIPEDPYLEAALQAPLPLQMATYAQSPDYVPDTDPEADPEEDDDEDPEDDPIDYLMMEEEDDELDVLRLDEGAEEEHSKLIYLPFVVVALPAYYTSAEEDEPFLRLMSLRPHTTTSPPALSFYKQTRISIPEPLPIPAWSDSEVARLLAMSSPPASPLSPWSSSPPQIPFPLSPPSPATSLSLPLFTTLHTLPHRPDAPLPMPTSAPTLLPPLLLLPSASSIEADRADVNRTISEEVRYSLGPSYEDEIVETLQGASVSTDTELGAHVRDFESMVRRDTDEIYTMLDDEQIQRRLLAGRVNMLFRDRRGHAHTRLLMETEAMMSREAWVRSMDASDLARVEVMSLRTTVHAQMSEITELQVHADHNRPADYSDVDCYAYTTERDDSTSGTGHHTTGAGDSLTGTGDDITGAGYCITGTAGTHWGSIQATLPAISFYLTSLPCTARLQCKRRLGKQYLD